MNFNYDFQFSGPMDEEMMAVFGIVGGVLLAVFAVVGVFALVLYILRSLALYTMAKKRGLRKAWLAWIPVTQEWIIGSLSDQYQYVAQGKIRNLRKLLLGLQIGAVLLGSVNSGIGMVTAFAELMEGFRYGHSAGAMFLPGAVITLVSLTAGVVGITAFVFRQICMYDLYRSCNPKNSVVFLVLGILFPVTEPFFLMSCRYKEEGMPPRRNSSAQPVENCDADPEPFRDPVDEPYVYQTYEPVNQEEPFVDVVYDTPVDPE